MESSISWIKWLAFRKSLLLCEPVSKIYERGLTALPGSAVMKVKREARRKVPACGRHWMPENWPAMSSKAKLALYCRWGNWTHRGALTNITVTEIWGFQRTLTDVISLGFTTTLPEITVSHRGGHGPGGLGSAKDRACSWTLSMVDLGQTHQQSPEGDR